MPLHQDKSEPIIKIIAKFILFWFSDWFVKLGIEFSVVVVMTGFDKLFLHWNVQWFVWTAISILITYLTNPLLKKV